MLVFQNNTGNLFCPTLVVAPLTTQVNKKKDQPTHYLLSGVRGLQEDSVALLEQIKTIDKSRVISYLGKVSKGWILNYLETYQKAKKRDFVELLKDSLPDTMDEQQKIYKVQNLLQALRKEGKIETDSDNHRISYWRLSK